MPIITECPFCQVRKRAPDQAVGSSVTCRRCKNLFTVAPVTAVQMTSASTPVLTPTTESSEHLTAPLTPLAPAPVKATVEPPLESVKAFVPPPASRPKINPLGAASFILGSVGLLFASMPYLGVATLPMAVLGLALGVLGLMLAHGGGDRRIGWLIAGTVVSLPVLILSLFFPGVIGNPWPRAQSADPTGRTVAVPFRRSGTAPAPLSETEWPDASTQVVQQGDLRVRVVAVALRPVEFRNYKPVRYSRERYLLISLRVYNAGAERRIEYTSWGESQQPVLRDNLGKTYRPRTFGPEIEVGGRTRRAPLGPGGHIDDLLVFEPPPPTVEYLRLELPAEAAGGKGPLRLQIPRTMIVNR